MSQALLGVQRGTETYFAIRLHAKQKFKRRAPHRHCVWMVLFKVLMNECNVWRQALSFKA